MGGGGASRGPGMGSSSLGGFGGGIGGGPDGFGSGMRSAAENVQSALSSLSENAGSRRTSRYGQSVYTGSSPSSFDVSRSDRSSVWGNPNYNQSIRDAGEKKSPGSVLGSIAATSQRRVKEIERLVYYEEEGRPGPSMPQTGERIGDVGGGYKSRRYSDENPRLPLQRSSGKSYNDDSSRFSPKNADPYSANGPRRTDRFDRDNDLYDDRMDQFDTDHDLYDRDDRNSRRGGRRNTHPSNGPKRMDRFGSDSNPNDGERRDHFDSDDDLYARDDRDTLRGGRRITYPSNEPRRMDRFDRDDLYDDDRMDQYDTDYDLYDRDDRNTPRGGRRNPHPSNGPRRMDRADSDYDLNGGRMDQYDNDRYDNDDRNAPRGGRRNPYDESTKNSFDRARRRMPPRRMDQYERDSDPYESDGIRSPSSSQRGRRSGGLRPFGVNSRNIDYQSMNRPFDGRGKENFNTRNRRPRSIGEFDRPKKTKWGGYAGQSLVDYQVKPSRRGRQRDKDFIDDGRRPSPGFDPEFDDPYFEPN